LIGAKGPECYYNHALATWALAEAAQAIDSPELLARVERAVKYALAALSGVRWKYTEAPNGESDATLTAQMVCALGAAWDAGIDFPREKLHAANDWLEDDEPEDAKCVAPAMYARLATEPSSKYHQYAVGQTEVLLKDLPAWPDEPKGLDFGYWFWSSQGMAAALEASRRDKWRTPLLEALLERQQRGKSDLAGSFDPLDARRATLGRLGSTALLALALEAPVRTAR
jgi:hypothetical protein